MKKILLTIITALLVFTMSISVVAYTLADLSRADGSGTVKYRGTQNTVTIPVQYDPQATDFRGVWVSHLVEDIAPYQNKDQYIEEMTKVFDVMEYFHMNTIIFHIRTHNNALYQSEMNPVASWWKTVDFATWDPLAWMIGEAHRRGIEFQAWMNPYRVSTNNSLSLSDLAATFPENNAASDPNNLLASGKSVILNPGEPAVRDFLVDTVMEVIENYDVDAIHFDDYFYISGVDDARTRSKYNQENLSVDDFRRKQVDLFIEDLSKTMHAYNEANGRVVQLGISPSGIYQNGSYVPMDQYRYDEQGNLTYPLASNTGGFAHYGDYLYSDTKKWIDKAWIDYILPQSYWSFEHPSAGFADVMDWWSGALKNSRVNLYSGMGLYMIDEGSVYSWKTNTEAYHQVLYGTKYEDIRGHAVFSFKHLKYAYERQSGYYYENFRLIQENAWTNPALLPEIRTYTPVILPKVQNIAIKRVNDGNSIDFTGSETAKFYAVYRSRMPITYAPEELVDIIGGGTSIHYVDPVDGEFYYYGIKPVSVTNTPGEGAMFTSLTRYTVTFVDDDGTILKTEFVKEGESAVPPQIPPREGYLFAGWNQDFSEVNGNVTVTATYRKDITVTFIADDRIIVSLPLSKLNTLPAIPAKSGYDQTAPVWSITDFSHYTDDVTVNAVYTLNSYKVRYIGIYGNVIREDIVSFGGNATPPEAPSIPGYLFVSWDKDAVGVTDNITVRAQYQKISEKPDLFMIIIPAALIFFASGIAFIILRLKKRK